MLCQRLPYTILTRDKASHDRSYHMADANQIMSRTEMAADRYWAAMHGSKILRNCNPDVSNDVVSFWTENRMKEKRLMICHFGLSKENGGTSLHNSNSSPE